MAACQPCREGMHGICTERRWSKKYSGGVCCCLQTPADREPKGR